MAQFLALAALAAWVVYRGAAGMEYRWQWYRVPRFFYRVIDGELIWGPLVDGLLVTLEIAAWGLVLTLLIGMMVALLRLSQSISGRLLAVAYLEIIRNIPPVPFLFLFYFFISSQLLPLLHISEQRFFEVWIFTGCMYFVVCYSLALVFNRLERRMGTGRG